MRTLLFLILIGLSDLAFAQTPVDSLPNPARNRAVLLKPFTIEAKVISLLQGHDDIGVVQITKVATNPWNLKKGDEILVSFLIKPENSKKVAGGDLIRAETIGTMNKNTVQVDYRVLRYSVLMSAIKASEVPSNSESQK